MAGGVKQRESAVAGGSGEGERMSALLASSSGADIVGIGRIDLKSGRLLKACVGGVAKSGGTSLKPDNVKAIVEAFAASERFETELNSRSTRVDRNIWYFAPKHVICIGGLRDYPIAQFVVFLFGNETELDTPANRNLARIGLTYAGSLAIDRAASPNVEAEIPSAISESVLKCLSFGYIALDSSGNIRALKDSVDGWLEQNRTFKIVNGRLCAERQKDRQMLMEAIEAASDDRRKVSVLLPEASEPGSTETVYVMPIDGAKDLVLLVFGQGRTDRNIRELALKAMGLTAAERRLTSHLMEGDSLADAAESANLTISTARSYLKSIFTKTGMRRQSQLVTLCLKLTPAIARSEKQKMAQSKEHPVKQPKLAAVK